MGLVIYAATYPRNYLKDTSNAQLLCCENLLKMLIRQRSLADSAFSSARALSLNVICIFEIASSILTASVLIVAYSSDTGSEEDGGEISASVKT